MPGMSWNVMFRHGDRRDTVRCVMRCHDLHACGVYPAAGSGMRSVFSRIPLLRLRGRGWGGRPSFGVTGVSRGFARHFRRRKRALSQPLPRAGEEICRNRPVPAKPSPSASCMSFHHPVSFHSIPFSPPPCLPERRDPNSRVSCAGVRARGRAFRAGAVRAPDCPPALVRAGQAQGALRPLAESGAFFAPARHGKRSSPAEAASFLWSNIAYDFDISIHNKESGQNFMNILSLSVGSKRQVPASVPTCAPTHSSSASRS